jgi:hypothetical protein
MRSTRMPKLPSPINTGPCCPAVATPRLPPRLPAVLLSDDPRRVALIAQGPVAIDRASIWTPSKPPSPSLSSSAARPQIHLPPWLLGLSEALYLRGDSRRLACASWQGSGILRTAHGFSQYHSTTAPRPLPVCLSAPCPPARPSTSPRRVQSRRTNRGGPTSAPPPLRASAAAPPASAAGARRWRAPASGPCRAQLRGPVTALTPPGNPCYADPAPRGHPCRHRDAHARRRAFSSSSDGTCAASRAQRLHLVLTSRPTGTVGTAAASNASTLLTRRVADT